MWEVAHTDFVGYTLFELKDSWLKWTNAWFFSCILFPELSFLVVRYRTHIHLRINAHKDKIHRTLWLKQMFLFCYLRVHLAKSNTSLILKWKLSSQKTRAMPIPDNSQAGDIQIHVLRPILGVCHGEAYNGHPWYMSRGGFCSAVFNSCWYRSSSSTQQYFRSWHIKPNCKTDMLRHLKINVFLGFQGSSLWYCPIMRIVYLWKFVWLVSFSWIQLHTSGGCQVFGVGRGNSVSICSLIDTHIKEHLQAFW